MRIDLHIHTTASDGCWSPAELVGEVKKAGLYLFAVADHDSVGNVEETKRLARRTGLNFVTGVEITSKLNDNICHILGYGIDPKNSAVLDVCRENTRRMRELSIRQMEKMKDLGFDVDIEEFRSYKFDKSRGGNSVANYLIDKGHFKTFTEALEAVVTHVEWTKPDYFPPDAITSIIRNAGGHPVLAHPGSSLLGRRLSDRAIDTIISMGVEGLECYTNYHDKADIQKYASLCRKRGLLITAGSDCHGPIFTDRNLGTPPATLEALNLTGIWPIH